MDWMGSVRGLVEWERVGTPNQLGELRRGPQRQTATCIPAKNMEETPIAPSQVQLLAQGSPGVKVRNQTKPCDFPCLAFGLFHSSAGL